MVRHLGKRGFARGEGLLAVGVVEERSVCEAWAHYAFVAGTYLCGVTADDVADGDEPRRQLAVGAAHREVALVFHERRDEHLFRQGEEALFELACHGHRPFHEGGHFVQQFSVEYRFATASGSSSEHAGADTFATVTEVCDDMALLEQQLGIVRGGRNG